MKISKNILMVMGALLVLGAMSRKAVSLPGQMLMPQAYQEQYSVSWEDDSVPYVADTTAYPINQFGPTEPMTYAVSEEALYEEPILPATEPVVMLPRAKKASLPKRALGTISSFGRGTAKKFKSMGAWANRVKKQLPKLAQTVGTLGAKANMVMPYIHMLDRELGIFDAMMAGQTATDRAIVSASLNMLGTTIGALGELENVSANDPRAQAVREKAARELIGIAGGAYKNINAIKVVKDVID